MTPERGIVFRLGAPRFQGLKEKVIIAMGSAAPVVRDADEAKWIEDEEEWLKANAAYRPKEREFGPLMVKDGLRDKDYRVWRLEPALVEGRRAVLLYAQFETSDGHGSFKVFRGQHAVVGDPFEMSRSIRSVVEHVAREQEFDRVGTTVAIRRQKVKVAWGTVSRVFAQMHNFGLIRAVGQQVYLADDPGLEPLWGDKDWEHVEGRKTTYSKTDGNWEDFFKQWESFIDDGRDRTRFYEPSSVGSLSAA